jgi:hypothetical protein
MAHSALQFSDAWILVALLSATEERTFASLNDLIRAADAVNHAIISHGELETGFARLVPLGHAVVGANGYAPSKQVREYWATKTEAWASLYKSWEKLAKHIGASAINAGPLPETDEEQYVNKATYEAVVASYAVNIPNPFLGKK